MKNELKKAYAQYYKERHELEDSNTDPNEWELKLWEKYEQIFIN